MREGLLAQHEGKRERETSQINLAQPSPRSSYIRKRTMASESTARLHRLMQTDARVDPRVIGYIRSRGQYPLLNDYTAKSNILCCRCNVWILSQTSTEVIWMTHQSLRAEGKKRYLNGYGRGVCIVEDTDGNLLSPLCKSCGRRFVFLRQRRAEEADSVPLCIRRRRA